MVRNLRERQDIRSSNSLRPQVEVDGGKVEVSGEWNLASTLLPVTIDGTDRTLQVRSQVTGGLIAQKTPPPMNVFVKDTILF